MRKLAAATGADLALWEATGLCHDLDYEVTRSTPERHGLVVAGWLRDRLPADALLAIEAHDHRTGVQSESPLAHALKLADALAIAAAHTGMHGLIDALRSPGPAASLLAQDPNRPWLADMVIENAAALRIAPADLAAILREE